MQNEEQTNESQVEQQEGQTVEVEETPAEETTEESQSETTEVTPEAFAHAQSEAAKYRRLFEKSQKPKPQTVAKAPQTASPSNIEETVLLAQGMPKNLLAELKAVAAVRKVSLIDAQADPIFIAVKDKFEKDLKKEKASMPASRGSSVTKEKKSFNSPGLSREEHMAMIKGL